MAPAPRPPARQIPGITVEDRFPRACVDCHVDHPEEGVDARFSTLLASWAEQVDRGLLEAAAQTTADGVTLEGRHPATRPEVLADIPSSCIGCHTRRADKAPDIARLVHRVHLQGGEESVFLTVFGGECTHCHKLDPLRGAWTVPSAAEHPNGSG